MFFQVGHYFQGICYIVLSELNRKGNKLCYFQETVLFIRGGGGRGVGHYFWNSIVVRRKEMYML